MSAPALPADSSTDIGLGLGLGYGIAITVGALVLVSSIMLASYACVRIKSGATGPHHGGVNGGDGEGSPTTVRLRVGTGGGGVGMGPSLGLQPAVNSLPGPLASVKILLGRPVTVGSKEVVIGESKRLPEPNSGPCSICLCEYRPKETLRCLSDCNHCFHMNCIDQWLRMSRACPLCRSSPAPSRGGTPVATPLSELVPLAFHGR